MLSDETFYEVFLVLARVNPNREYCGGKNINKGWSVVRGSQMGEGGVTGEPYHTVCDMVVCGIKT